MTDYTRTQAQRAAHHLDPRPLGWSEEQCDVALRRFHTRRLAQKRRSRVARASVGGLLAAAAAFSLWWLASAELPPKPRELSSRPTEQQEATASANSAPAATSRLGRDEAQRGQGSVRFTDGSLARLKDEHSELVLRDNTSEKISVELVSGAVEFDVQTRPTRHFVVIAGGVTVRVIGTAFTVTRSTERVHVAVARGKVSVTGGGQARRLMAGEAAWFDTRGAPSDSTAHTPSPFERAQAVQAASEPKDQNKGAEFIRYHQKAQYNDAYRLLREAREQLGSGDEHWMRAADAARYSGHAAEAVAYLKRVNESGRHGSTAAFILGRLYHYELGQPSAAAQHYARAQRLAPSGPMAEDALFREIECRALAGDADTASHRAQDFLKRYPGSTRETRVAAYVLNP